jgi:hypothetical protein
MVFILLLFGACTAALEPKWQWSTHSQYMRKGRSSLQSQLRGGLIAAGPCMRTRTYIVGRPTYYNKGRERLYSTSIHI